MNLSKPSFYGYKSLPATVLIVLSLYMVYTALYTPNLFITIPVIAFPVITYRLLWINNQPNVLFWGMIMQWLSASTQLLYCNFLGITLEQKMTGTVFPAYKMDEATVVSIISLYFFLLGLYFAVRKLWVFNLDVLISRYDAKKVLIVYGVASLVIYLTSGLIWNYKAIVQYVYFFFYIKWGFFLVTFYLVHKQKSMLHFFMYGIIILEILLSFTSFFAGSLINIASYTVMGVLSLQPRLTIRSYLLIIVFGLCSLHFMILWSAIKPDYRTYVSKGENVQTILVSKEESEAKFAQLITNVDDKKYALGIEKLVDRLGYIQFFGASLDYVPRVVPYQDGKIYLGALQNYLVPRFLNPDKPVLDDSKHTSRFTGIGLSGRLKATSFSLGYIPDAYIDFGPIYMYPVICLLGYLFGLAYYFFSKKSPDEFWVWILTGPFFLLVNIYGADTNKAMGWMLIYFITVAALRKVLINFVDPLMRYEEAK